MSEIKYTLPLPPMILGPNRREHWAKKAKYKAALRSECYDIVKNDYKAIDDSRSIPITVIFFTGNNRADLDNLLASAKSALDGMAEALGVNDKKFRPITVDAIVDKTNPRMEVFLSANIIDL